MRSWLVANREAKGFKQKEVSDAVGISQPSYCNIENGVKRPSVDTAKKIAAVLGFEWTQFFEEGKDGQ